MDPQFFGDMELDAGPLLDYIDEARQSCGVHLTMTHLIGKAVAHGLSEVPSSGSDSRTDENTRGPASMCSSS